MRNLITGGAGFLGSHLIDKLMIKNEEVICLDNFSTGQLSNVEKWFKNKNFKLINHDVRKEIDISVNRIWHLACPASPKIYQLNPIETSEINFLGTLNMLKLAKKYNCRILLASSSEIYGDPLIHPQNENYFGNVNPIGKRSCYEIGKRISESLCQDFLHMHQTEIRIARIFNTYGPRLTKNDGRVINNFLYQALSDKPLTIYGDGSQTRTFCFVDDLIHGLIKIMNNSYNLPINIGSDKEIKIIDLAHIIRNKINPYLIFKKLPLPGDDPKRRRPDLEIARKLIQWNATIGIEEGLNCTIKFLKEKKL